MDYIKVTIVFVLVMLSAAACSVFVQSQRDTCGSSQSQETTQTVDSTKFQIKVDKQ